MVIQKVDILDLHLQLHTNQAVHLKAAITRSNSTTSLPASPHTASNHPTEPRVLSNRRMVALSNTELPPTHNNPSTNMEAQQIPNRAMVQAHNYHTEPLLIPNLHTLPHLMLNLLMVLLQAHSHLTELRLRSNHRSEESNIKKLTDALLINLLTNILLPQPSTERHLRTAEICLNPSTNTSKVCTMQNILVAFTATILQLLLCPMAATRAKPLLKQATQTNPAMADSNDGNLMTALERQA